MKDYNTLFDELEKKVLVSNGSSNFENMNLLMSNIEVPVEICSTFDSSNIKIDNARNELFNCLKRIILEVPNENSMTFNDIELNALKIQINKMMNGKISSSISNSFNSIYFILYLHQTNEIFIFKRFGFNKYLDNIVLECILKIFNAKSFKFVTDVFDKAYGEQLNNYLGCTDETDVSKGTNIYSLKWFLNDFIRIENYDGLEKKIKDFEQKVLDYFSVYELKKLKDKTKFNFKRIVLNRLINFDYSKLTADIMELPENTKERIRSANLSNDDFNYIKNQYLFKNFYSTFLSDNDYSESFCTAEWLYSSIKQAKSIDLTIIGMGYIKCLEQLIFEILKKNGNAINKKKTIGEMAFLFSDNKDYFGDIDYVSKVFIIEKIHEYTKIRNGYFHKDNIKLWSKIDLIRNKTYELLFLLLGSIRVNETIDNMLHITEINLVNDFYKLSEFVDYYSGVPYLIEYTNEIKKWYIGLPDSKTIYFDNGIVKYSGVYFKPLRIFNDEIDNVSFFDTSKMPSKIFIGKLTIGKTPGETCPVAHKLIFEEGKFVGPSIIESANLDY